MWGLRVGMVKRSMFGPVPLCALPSVAWIYGWSLHGVSMGLAATACRVLHTAGTGSHARTHKIAVFQCSHDER